MIRFPKFAAQIVGEVARHVLRHPVVGVVAAAHDNNGRWLMIRRADTGTWAMPGGTLDWGETMSSALVRELAEEAGGIVLKVEQIVGVYSRPDRDPRFHAVTVVVRVLVDSELCGSPNPLEIREVGWFDIDSIPRPLAYLQDDMFNDVLAFAPAPIFE
jgi:8-oxo-dGTP diphosphatase